MTGKQLRILSVNALLLLIVVLLVMVVYMCGGCTVTKDSFEEKISRDSTATEELRRKITQLQTDTSVYLATIRQLEYLGATFTVEAVDTAAIRRLFKDECPPARIDSFIREISKPTIVKQNADGSLEIISNRLKTLTQSKLRIEEEAKQLRIHNERLEEELKNSKVITSVDTKTEEKHSKTTFIPWWVWLIIAGSLLWALKAELIGPLRLKKTLTS